MHKKLRMQMRASFSDNPKSAKSKSAKWVGLVAFVVTFAMCGAVVEAQQPAGIPRIGILIAASASFFSARVEAFRQRLRELGYVEGKNIVIEYRYAEGKLERLPDLAAELVRLKVDVIVTSGRGYFSCQEGERDNSHRIRRCCRSSRNWACLQPGATRREYHRT